jgi:hypothetical protein
MPGQIVLSLVAGMLVTFLVVPLSDVLREDRQCKAGAGGIG